MLRTALTIIHVLISGGLIATVLLQSGKSAGLGAIGGGAEALFGKRKGMDDLLAKFSAGLAIAFVITALSLSVLVN